MWSAEHRKTRRDRLEQRLLLDDEPLGSLKDVLKTLRAQLLAAWSEDVLRGRQDEVYSLLKTEPPNRDGHVLLAGGGRYDGRFDSRDGWEGWSAFQRDDGARFSFALTFAERGRDLHLVAQSFTFGFPPLDGLGLSTVRWDLDRRGVMHASDGLRSHLHLHKDLRIPAAQLHPAELLDLFLYRLGRSEPRAGVT